MVGEIFPSSSTAAGLGKSSTSSSEPSDDSEVEDELEQTIETFGAGEICLYLSNRACGGEVLRSLL